VRRQFLGGQRHEFLLLRATERREAFHTSPQLAQRQ
jgi:hypothetical protein